MPEIERTQKEIDEVIDWTSESESTGSSNYPGMTYEQGVRAAIDWVTGESDERPDE